MGVENARMVSAFRAFRTQLRTAFERYQSPFVILDVLLAWGTTRFSSIPVQHEPRHSGASNYTFSMLLIHAANMVTGFTVLPLQLASLLGFGFAVFGVLVLFYVIGRYLIQGGSVPGFPFLASIVAIFSGVQLFALGIIGEYLARMHFRIMEKPTYVIREMAEEEPDESSRVNPASSWNGTRSFLATGSGASWYTGWRPRSWRRSMSWRRRQRDRMPVFPGRCG